MRHSYPKHTTLFLFILFVFGPKPLLSQSYDWAFGIESYFGNTKGEMVIDGEGNTYTMDHMFVHADFLPGPDSVYVISRDTTGDAINSPYIVKYDSTGDLVWVRVFTDTTTDRETPILFQNLGIDNSGNLYISGTFSGIVDFDPGPGEYLMISDTTNIYRNRAFILKLNTDGEFQWVLNTETHKIIYEDLALDKQNNISLIGTFVDTVDFDLGPNSYFLSSSFSVFSSLPNINNFKPQSGFIQKLDSAGNFLWASIISNDSSAILPQSIAHDNQGNINIVGEFAGKVTFSTNAGTESFISASEDCLCDGAVLCLKSCRNTFICQLSPSGQLSWVKTIGPGYVSGRQILTDSNDDLIISGAYSYKKVDFDPGPDSVFLGEKDYRGLSNSNSFIMKMTQTGDFVWAKPLHGWSCIVQDMALDELNQIYLTGYFGDSADFDPGLGTRLEVSLRGPTSYGIFLLKLDAQANLSWLTWTGREFKNRGDGVEVDQYGNVYSTGITGYRIIDMDPGPNVNDLIIEPFHTYRSRFIRRYSQGICDNLAIVVDSLEYPSCENGLGFAVSHAVNGLPPYQYNWTTTPAVFDSSVTFEGPGTYQLNVLDANACYRSTSFWVEGPTKFSDFDMQANLVSTNFRTGFDAFIWIDAFNDGCAPQSGTLHFTLDSLLTINSVFPNPDTIIGDNLIWNLDSINFDSGHFNIELDVKTSLLAQISDTVDLIVKVLPFLNDLDTTNNTRLYRRQIINSYDPNDKQVNPVGACAENYVLKNQALTYTLRFQNTGNAEAINIFLLDSISPFLDISTLKILGKSHEPMITEILPGNVLKFSFDDIYLPDSTSNESESHGYVIFEISPQSGLPDGTVIENKAEIYFDFNPAIITNSVSVTLQNTIPICNTLSIERVNTSRAALVYPNPTSKFLQISEDFKHIHSVEILGTDGQLLKRVNIVNNSISVESLPAGIYFIRLQDQEKSLIEKFVKF